MFVEGPVTPLLGELRVHTYTWPNGLQLRVVPDGAAPTVAVQTWFRVGSADEEAGKTGLAHLFEHLMFKGTETYSEGEFQARVDAMGGSQHLNAWTWLDQTVFVGAVPAPALDRYLALEADRMVRLVVDEPAFLAEREVVINERRLVVDNDPGGTMDEALMALAFAVHPYGWPTIGWQRDLDALTAEDARAFYKRWYAPDNATIVIVGDVLPADAAAAVDRHYGHLPASGVVRGVPPVEPEQTEMRRHELALPLTGERIQMVLKVPPYTHADTPALLVLNAILSGSRSARLIRGLRDTGLVAEVGSGLLPLRGPAAMSVSLHGRPGVGLAAAEAALWREFERMAAEGPSAGELATGIAQWEAASWGKLADASGKADFLGWALAHTGDPADGLRRLAAIQHVTAEDVRVVAGRYLRPERATVVLARPQGEAAANAPELPPLVAPAATAIAGGRPAVALSDQPINEVRTHHAHGAEILESFDPTLPIVQLRLHFPVGSAADLPGKEGTAHLLAEMLLRGTRQRDRNAFEEALDQLGASLWSMATADGVVLGGRVLGRNWGAFVALVREALTEPAFPAEELVKLQAETQAEIAALRDSDEDLADLALSRAVFGADHPYGRDLRGTAASVEAVTTADLAAFHATWLRSDRVIVGLAGAYDRLAVAELEGLLAALGAGAPAAPAIPPAAGKGPRICLVDKPDRNQAQLRLGLWDIGAREANFPAFVLFNDGFGVGFGGRLMKEVRVQRGWSYFAYSMPLLHPAGGEWQIRLAPGNEYAADALALVLDLVAKAAAEGLTAEEVEQARATRLQGLPFELDTAAKRLELEVRKRLIGYDRVAATHAMTGLTLAEVNAAFAERIQAERLVVAVVGTAAALRGPLEAKFGPVEVIPYDAL